MDKEKEVDAMFVEFKAIFLEWLKLRPTGEFNIYILLNEGGIRARPKISMTKTI